MTWNKVTDAIQGFDQGTADGFTSLDAQDGFVGNDQDGLIVYLDHPWFSVSSPMASFMETTGVSASGWNDVT